MKYAFVFPGQGSQFVFAREVNDAVDRDFFYIMRLSRQASAMLVIGFVLILGIYGDEFKAMTMIGVIGSGLDRNKFVLAKFLDVLILGCQFMVLTGIFAIVIAKVFGIHLSSTELSFMVTAFFLDFLELICYVTISALFFFLSENVAMGVFAFLAFEIIIPLALTFASAVPFVQKYHLESYYTSGLISTAFSDFVMGDVLEGLCLVVITILVYIGLPLFGMMFYFGKKELDF